LNRPVVKTFGILITLVCLGIVAPCYFSGLIGNSRARVRLDHSIEVPASTSGIECAFPFSTTQFMDSGAEATFTISRADLPGFLAEFPHFKESPDDPPEWATLRRHLSPAWRKGVPIAVYDGRFPEGHRTLCEIWPVDSTSVGIYLVSVWN
jgi:hypothetical protein